MFALSVSRASDWGEGCSNQEGETTHLAKLVPTPFSKLLRHPAVDNGWHMLHDKTIGAVKYRGQHPINLARRRYFESKDEESDLGLE